VQNIFLSQNNTVLLGDFGISRLLSRPDEKVQTVIGTPYYLSPEILSNYSYSYSTDIWSIGVVLYELCALKPPFEANSLPLLAVKIL